MTPSSTDAFGPVDARSRTVWVVAAVAIAVAQPLVAWWWIASHGVPAGSFGEQLGWWIGFGGYLVCAAASVVLAAIDWTWRRLPDLVVLPSLALVAVLLSASAAASADWEQLGRVLLCGLAFFAVYLVLSLLSRGGIGGGDVKLAPLVGVALGYAGWNAAWAGGLLGFMFAACAAAVLLVQRRSAGRTRLAFGPWMLLGTWCGLVVFG